MLEVFVEVGNFRDCLLNLLIIRKAASNDDLEVRVAAESASWVDAARAVVLICADEAHVVLFLTELGVVKEERRFECAIGSEVFELDDSVFTVEAQSLTVAHSIDYLLSDVLAHVLIALSSECYLDDF